jgi:phosphoglycolate phosphatase-like HAD superfamily hydrolase
MLLLILDIDGTLTDTVSIHHSCFLDALSEYEISNINTNWGNYTHHTDSWILAEIFKKAFDRPPSLHEVKTIEDGMTACLEDWIETAPFREIVGARAFVRAVQASSQIAYAFATGSFRAPAQRKLEALHISYPSELLVTASEFESREEIVQQAIARARKHWGTMDFDRTISIGDGYWDLITARKLDLEFIGIATGERADVLLEAGADVVFPDFEANEITRRFFGTT